MVVLIDAPEGIVACRPRWADRWRARLLASRWDGELARGVPPEYAVCLALRAERLVRPHTRRWLAHSLHRLLNEAGRPARHPTPLSSICRRRLLAAEETIILIIEDLERPAPVSARGVALLCLLLQDGRGPLYGPGSADELRDRFVQAREHLAFSGIW